MSNVKIYDAGELFPLTDVVLLSDHNKALFDREKLISNQAKRIKELEEKLAMKLDPALHPTCADCDKCSVVISKMETTEPKWVSVKDRLPDFGVNVLITDGKYCYVMWRVECKKYGYYWDDGECGASNDVITHWMPLPSAPTTEESSPIEKEDK